MKTELIAAGLAAILSAPLPAQAACAYYGPNGNVAASELPVPHWGKMRRELAAEVGLSAAGQAMFSRILADADLCQRDMISFREFQARVDEAIARWEQSRSSSTPMFIPMPFSCMSDGFGGFNCM